MRECPSCTDHAGPCQSGNDRDLPADRQPGPAAGSHGRPRLPPRPPWGARCRNRERTQHRAPRGVTRYRAGVMTLRQSFYLALTVTIAGFCLSLVVSGGRWAVVAPLTILALL